MATLSNIIFAAVKNIQAQRRGKVVWTVFFLEKKKSVNSNFVVSKRLSKFTDSSVFLPKTLRTAP